VPAFYYEQLDQHGDLTRYRAATATTGPWSPALQHGGPPNALAVASAEQAVSVATGRSDLVALRLSADFVGPVPVGEIDVRTRVVRAARSAALAEVTIAAGGRDCLHVRVWFVRDADTSALAVPLAAPVLPPEGLPRMETDFAYGASLEWRLVEGGFGQAGPGTAWILPLTSLVEGYEYSGLARAVLVGDSASGLSAELDWKDWSFVNVDLDLHLARPFIGEWIMMDAVTQLSPNGSALARSTLSDVHGVVGAGLQTLVVSPVRR
jgi:hypothetical protein